MFKTASTSCWWSVGAWTVNARELTSLRAAISRPAKAALKVPKLRGDTDEMYHRRINRAFKLTMTDCKLPDIDAYVLSRMYDYAGHLQRAVTANPLHLAGHLLKYRDAEWKDALTAMVGHQGHNGRISPWNWERQFHSYFRSLSLNWQEVARDREKWFSHRRAWIRHALGSRSRSTNFGVL